jgi:hypothetical protein
MMMTSIVRLRLINLMGSLLFVVYGLLIEAYPVALMNLLIAGVNVYYLVKVTLDKQNRFSILEISPNSNYVKEFLNYYMQDINKFSPDFQSEAVNSDVCWLILKDMKVAGLLLGSEYNDTSMKIELDYILKPYRDFKPGTFIYEDNQKFFLQKGYNKLLASPGNHVHNQYLERMGFLRNNDFYEKKLTVGNH